MQAAVLIVEDEPDLAALMALYLEKDGVNVCVAGSAEAGLKNLAATHFDLVVLDINLPGMDGFEFLLALRKESAIPVIICSAREADEDLILGLGIGADEFVTKPVAPRVLVARIRAMLRRSRLAEPTTHKLFFGPYTLDTEGFLLSRNGERVILSGKEFDLLIFLATHAGKAFSVKELYDAVWGNAYGDVGNVGVYVQRLRKKLEENPQDPRLIETVHGKGYRFNAVMLQRKAHEAEN